MLKPVNMRLFSPYLFVLIMLLHVHIALALFLNSCPDKVMWDLRAQDMCGDKDKYMCLYDTNARKFRELCKDKPDFHRPAETYNILLEDHVIATNTNHINGGQMEAVTVSILSQCATKGLVPFNNGTITRDRKCRCDYTNYYTFLNSSRNRCYCDPTEEDCSCYRKTCNIDEVLTPGITDYDCVSVHAWTGVFVCPEYKAPM
ncbi:ADCK [Mytilus coruscus]|uniref:ADCK n=1 Tax=Mytilus coruscus TaxID=42192 RepID=A0A6J8ESW4_MYTCO|nr:ADCK [Mytilus coruscus]